MRASARSLRVPLCAMQFCGENLTHGARKNKGSGPGASKGLQAKSGSRIRTCPACVKPLPRCSVCMLAMDAANPAAIDTSRRQKLQLQPAKLGQQPPNVRTTLANSLFALADNASRNVARVFCAAAATATRLMLQRQVLSVGLRGASAAITGATRNV